VAPTGKNRLVDGIRLLREWRNTAGFSEYARLNRKNRNLFACDLNRIPSSSGGRHSHQVGPVSAGNRGSIPPGLEAPPAKQQQSAPRLHTLKLV
jgi:hypothetical protein